nr:solute carrier family 25 member 47 isoform X2 [Oncorhynchus nerka]
MHLADFVAGSVGGAFGVAVGYPLDTVKVRIQTQRRFTGVWQCIHTTWKTEGVNGFYRGMSMPVTTVSISSSVVFGVYRNVLQCLHQLRSTSTGLDFLPAKVDFFLSGLSGGVAQVSVMAPADIVKVRMQCQMVHQGLDAQQPKYRGPMHCLLTIAREEGFLGLYKGAGALALRDGPSFATYFTIYHVICEQLSPPENTQPGKHIVPENTQPGKHIVPENTQPGKHIVPENTQPGKHIVPENTQPGKHIVPENTQPGKHIVPGNTQPGKHIVPENTQPGKHIVPGNTQPGKHIVPENTQPGKHTAPGNTQPGKHTAPGNTQHLGTHSQVNTQHLRTPSQVNTQHLRTPSQVNTQHLGTPSTWVHPARSTHSTWEYPARSTHSTWEYPARSTHSTWEHPVR